MHTTTYRGLCHGSSTLSLIHGPCLDIVLYCHLITIVKWACVRAIINITHSKLFYKAYTYFLKNYSICTRPVNFNAFCCQPFNLHGSQKVLQGFCRLGAYWWYGSTFWLYIWSFHIIEASVHVKLMMAPTTKQGVICSWYRSISVDAIQKGLE